jgi:inner membrane protein
MGEYWVSGAIVMLCFAVAMATRSWGNMGYAPFFWDWAGYYKEGLIDGSEWKTNRFKWL